MMLVFISYRDNWFEIAFISLKELPLFWAYLLFPYSLYHSNLYNATTTYIFYKNKISNSIN